MPILVHMRAGTEADLRLDERNDVRTVSGNIEQAFLRMQAHSCADVDALALSHACTDVNAFALSQACADVDAHACTEVDSNALAD